MATREYVVKVEDNGDTRWHQKQLDGKLLLHRENDLPAIEYANGNKYWLLNGQYHRDNGPAVEYADGTKFWYQNGQYHRDNGPAIECANGHKYWYKSGKLHRDNGPAMEYPDGYKAWYLNAIQYTETEHLAKTKPVDPCANKTIEIEGKKYKLTPV